MEFKSLGFKKIYTNIYDATHRMSTSDCSLKIIRHFHFAPGDTLFRLIWVSDHSSALGKKYGRYTHCAIRSFWIELDSVHRFPLTSADRCIVLS